MSFSIIEELCNIIDVQNAIIKKQSESLAQLGAISFEEDTEILKQKYMNLMLGMFQN